MPTIIVATQSKQGNFVCPNVRTGVSVHTELDYSINIKVLPQPSAPLIEVKDGMYTFFEEGHRTYIIQEIYFYCRR